MTKKQKQQFLYVGVGIGIGLGVAGIYCLAPVLLPATASAVVRAGIIRSATALL